MSAFDREIERIGEVLAGLDRALGADVPKLRTSIDAAGRMGQVAKALQDVFVQLPKPVDPEEIRAEYTYEFDEDVLVRPELERRPGLLGRWLDLLDALVGRDAPVDRYARGYRPVPKTGTMELPLDATVDAPERVVKVDVGRAHRLRHDVPRTWRERVAFAWHRLCGRTDIASDELFDYEIVTKEESVPVRRTQAKDPIPRAYAERSLELAREVLAIDAFMDTYEASAKDLEDRAGRLGAGARELEQAIDGLAIPGGTKERIERARASMAQAEKDVAARAAAVDRLAQRLAELRVEFQRLTEASS